MVLSRGKAFPKLIVYLALFQKSHKVVIIKKDKNILKKLTKTKQQKQ